MTFRTLTALGLCAILLAGCYKRSEPLGLTVVRDGKAEPAVNEAPPRR